MNFEFYCENRTAPNVNPISLTQYIQLFEKDAASKPVEVSPFYQQRIQHFRSIASQTQFDLASILPAQLLSLAHTAELTSEDSAFAQRLIEESIIISAHQDFPEIYPILTNKDYDTFKHLSEINLRRLFSDKLSGVEALNANGISAILIRPEIKHISPLVYQYLECNHFNILYSKPLQLDFDQYWGLYEHAFGHPIKEGHVRRRVFGYVGRETELLLFNDPVTRYGSTGIDLAEGIKREHKGTAGKYDGKTLRGGLIYIEMHMAFSPANSLAQFALDPIMQYRYADPNEYNGGVPDQVLANLPGVHLPEGHEVLKDLAIMLDENDLDILLS